MTARYLEPRKVGERIVVTCTLVLQESAHLGGADADATSDRPLIRDADGKVFLAGTTLKGVLRGGSSCAHLFGGDDNQARLIVDDAPLMSEVETDVRDGVAINSKLGIAEHGKKYDIELLPAGTSFRASFEALLPEEGRDEVLGDLVATLCRLDDGVEVGARTSRGFGGLRREGPWTVQRFSGLSGLKAWLALGVKGSPAQWCVPATECDDIGAALGVQPPARPTTRVKIALELKLAGSLLIRSAVPGTGPADNVHIHARRVGADAEPVLTGTSLAGALRARCRRIARTLLAEDAALDLIDQLFGPEKLKSGKAHASRLRIAEVALKGTKTLRHTRVRIDPWTGGAADTALFTSEPVYGGTVSPLLQWRKPKDRVRERAEHALLLLALRDLALGDLPLGGEVGTGRGRFKPAHADGRFGVFGETELKLTADGGLVGDFKTYLEALMEWNHAEHPAGAA